MSDSQLIELFPSFEQGGRVATALERIADVQEGKTNGLSTLEQQIAASFAIARTGKIYRSRLYKYASNSSTAGVKLDDNEGLTCVPSTDTVEGQDDYDDIPVFRWVRCNYTRDDEDGFARPTVLENYPGFKTAGAYDVGTLHMTFYWRKRETEAYTEFTLSDSPHAELGLVPFCDAVKSDGTVMPYFIQSSFPSVTASDGLLRSQPGLSPAHHQSYNNMITNYQKKGPGYWGAGASRNAFFVIMMAIKYAEKSSQSVMRGCADFDSQPKCAVAETGVKRVLLASQGSFYVGCCVSVGTTTDRNVSTAHSVVDRAKVTSIETVTVDSTNYVALNLDIDSTIDTTTDDYVSTMPCFTGETDSVIGHHDGSYLSYTDGHHTLRICGQEYMGGQYIVASDTMIVFSDASGNKDIYVYPRGTAHVADSYANAEKVGSIPVTGEYYQGDYQVDVPHGVVFPGTKGSGDSVGVGDYCWGGGTPSAGSVREFLMNAALGDGGLAGAAALVCGNSLWDAYWAFASYD